MGEGTGGIECLEGKNYTYHHFFCHVTVITKLLYKTKYLFAIYIYTFNVFDKLHVN